MERTLNALSTELAAVTESTGKLAVGVEARPRIGSSGILWREGVIVTADHTVRREEEIPVILPDGTTARAELAGRDPGTDLAVLHVKGATGTRYESTAKLRAGELVIAVGRHEPGVLALLGMVSTAGGPWRTWRGGQLDALLRLDIAAYARSSGSVVVDSEGRVAGMLTGGLTRTAPIAIPATTIERVAGQLIEHGRIRRGYLGIGLQTVPLPEGRGQRAGVIILSVEPGGPAESGGLFLGDVLVSFNGHVITSTDDLQAALEGVIGQKLAAVVLRGGESFETQVQVGERRG